MQSQQLEEAGTVGGTVQPSLSAGSPWGLTKSGGSLKPDGSAEAMGKRSVLSSEPALQGSPAPQAARTFYWEGLGQGG